MMIDKEYVFFFNSEVFSGSKNMFFAEPEYVPVSDDKKNMRFFFQF